MGIVDRRTWVSPRRGPGRRWGQCGRPLRLRLDYSTVLRIVGVGLGGHAGFGVAFAGLEVLGLVPPEGAATLLDLRFLGMPTHPFAHEFGVLGFVHGHCSVPQFLPSRRRVMRSTSGMRRMLRMMRARWMRSLTSSLKCSEVYMARSSSMPTSSMFESASEISAATLANTPRR